MWRLIPQSPLGFAGWMTGSVALSGIGLLGTIVLLLSVLTNEFFTSLYGYADLLVVLFAFFIVAAALGVFAERR